MKARNYAQVLKARGYKRTMTDYVMSQVYRWDYQDGKIVVYVKEHKYNKARIVIWKDSHKKGLTFEASIFTTADASKSIEDFKQAEFDRQYLATEVIKIHEAFEQLKQMKSPKHIYCF